MPKSLVIRDPTCKQFEIAAIQNIAILVAIPALILNSFGGNFGCDFAGALGFQFVPSISLRLQVVAIATLRFASKPSSGAPRITLRISFRMAYIVRCYSERCSKNTQNCESCSDNGLFSQKSPSVHAQGVHEAPYIQSLGKDAPRVTSFFSCSEECGEVSVTHFKHIFPGKIPTKKSTTFSLPNFKISWAWTSGMALVQVLGKFIITVGAVTGQVKPEAVSRMSR